MGDTPPCRTWGAAATRDYTTEVVECFLSREIRFFSLPQSRGSNRFTHQLALHNAAGVLHPYFNDLSNVGAYLSLLGLDERRGSTLQR